MICKKALEFNDELDEAPDFEAVGSGWIKVSSHFVA